MSKKITFFFVIIIFSLKLIGQNYGNSWILGYSSGNNYSGSLINFNNSVQITGIEKEMKLEGSNTSICDSFGNLQFYSNGCYIANRYNEIMLNGDSIGLGKLASSFCETGGNPLLQSIIALPYPGSEFLYYIFYTDIEEPYEFPTGLFFPLAPTHLYYSIIDMRLDGGKGGVLLKNKLLISDTLSRSTMTAVLHLNKMDWWIIIPKSHSNCYYTISINKYGIDSTFLQCAGPEWNDSDATGQAVFSPNKKKYVRFNRFNGLNIFDFDPDSGFLNFSDIIEFELDSFDFAGVAFSPNSRFLYASAYNKIYQFDFLSENIENSKFLVGTLIKPFQDTAITSFNLELLGPDGKIYIGGTTPHNYLHVINNPNCSRELCDLNQYSLKLDAYNLYGMPNIPNYKSWAEFEPCDTVVNTLIPKTISEIVVFPNPFSDKLCIYSQNLEINRFLFKLYNINGNLVYSSYIQSIPYCNSFENLLTGIYIFSITEEDNIYYGKIIKE